MNLSEWTWIIGEVVAPFGIRGEMKVRLESDFPERFALLKRVCLCLPQRPPVLMTVESTRLHKEQVLMKLAGVATIDDAERWRGALVQIRRAEAVPLPEDNYYNVDLIGMEICTVEGVSLGRLEKVLPYPAQSLFQTGDILIPAVKEIVREVDMEARRIVVALPDGLLPETAEASDSPEHEVSLPEE